MYKLYINFKRPEDADLVEPLINLTIDNFVLRYCETKDGEVIPSKLLLVEPQINFYNYVWDCFIHVFSRELFSSIQYLEVADKDEIYNLILCIIDSEILGNFDSGELND